MSNSKQPPFNLKQAVITAVVFTVTSFVVNELIKRFAKRQDVAAMPIPPASRPTMRGMPGHEMASEHWRRQYYN